MDEGLKKRLIGATVLVSLVVIFVPMLLQRESVLEQEIHQSNIPIPPKREYRTSVLPAQDESLFSPPKEIVPIQPGEKPPSLNPSPPAEKQAQPSPSAPPVPATGLSAWMIQVASFSGQENAQRLVKTLREKDFSTSIQQESIKGKKVYRVLVGPEVDRNQAEKLLVRLNEEVKSLGLKGLIKRYP